ncbi:MAG: hypothetical protein KDA58_01240 [Planctomycetaceae bacterium]|nr:hypothetical protein [Planctomycetaceae bacterium]
MPRSSRRRWIFRLMYVGYLVALTVIAYRAYLWWMFSVPPADLTNHVDPIRTFYGELFRRGIVDSEANSLVGDGQLPPLEILLLGGSVAEQVATKLEQELTLRCQRPCRVHNAALSAHTTQDSLNKLQYLTEQGRMFDLIVVYHGINDIRMNCVPAELFRDDYSHCGWYRNIQELKQNSNLSLQRVARDGWENLIGLGVPDPDMLDYGADIKTGPAFRQHLEAIGRLADAQHTSFVLATFASHFAPGYTRAAYEAGELDYADGQYQLAIELWGHPENVRRGLEIHNGEIHELAASHPEWQLIDVASELQDVGNFSDVCHLSPAGIDRFVAFVADQLQPLLITMTHDPQDNQH